MLASSNRSSSRTGRRRRGPASSTPFPSRATRTCSWTRRRGRSLTSMKGTRSSWWRPERRRKLRPPTDRNDRKKLRSKSLQTSLTLMTSSLVGSEELQRPQHPRPVGLHRQTPCRASSTCLEVGRPRHKHLGSLPEAQPSGEGPYSKTSLGEALPKLRHSRSLASVEAPSSNPRP